MEIDDAMLVDLVRQFPFIFDKGNKDFKNKIMKENAWGTISSTLNVDVHMAQGRWKVLREKYCAERRKEKNMPSGSGAKKPWPLFSAMSFLEKHVTLRKTIGNIISPIQSSQPLKSISAWNSMNIIVDDTQLSECRASTSKDFQNESYELSDPFSEITEATEPDLQSENIPPTTNKCNISKEAKNEAPPLKRKRKKLEESELLTKLSTTFDTFNSYLQSKSKNSNQNLEDESTINLLKSVGNDLLQVKNKKIRHEAEIAIMQIAKKAVRDDMLE